VLLDEVVRESPEPGAGEQGETARSHEDREDDVGRGRQGGRRGEEDHHPAEDQEGADDQSRSRFARTQQGLEGRPDAREVEPASTLFAGAAGPQDRESDRRERDGPGEAIAEPEPAEPEDDQDARHDQSSAEEFTCRQARNMTLGRWHSGIDGLGWRENPEQQIDDDAEPGREREDQERKPNDERIEPQMLRNASGHASEHPVPATPPKGRSGRVGVDSAGREIELGHRH